MTYSDYRTRETLTPTRLRTTNVKAWLSPKWPFILLYMLSYMLEVTSVSPTRGIAVTCCTAMIIFWHGFLFAHTSRSVWKHSIVGVVVVTLHLVGGYCLTQIR